MSPRTRVAAIVVALSIGAAALVLGVTLVQSGDEASDAGSAPTPPRAEAPPLLLDLGLRSDAQADALRRAQRLYDRGRRREAGRIFRRFDALPAEIGGVFAAWPDRTVERMERIVTANPRSALARLHLGFALYWSGRRDAGLASWRQALRVQPDSVSAVHASDLLHPNSPRGLPTFVPSFGPPPAIAALPPGRQLDALERAARRGGVRAKLLYGVALQRIGKPRSAE
ncbi:MAG: tetratricopeptide repeat protein, partial [Gaiellaceae bacterium]